MAFELGPDGKPVEVASSYNDKNKTQPPGGNKPQAGGDTKPPGGGWQPGQTSSDAPTKPGGGHDMFAHVNNQQDMRPKGMNATAEPPTKPKGGGAGAGTVPTEPPAMDKPQNVPPAEPKTRIFQPTAPSGNTAQELVCGWLVIVDGPGKGASLVVGPGQSFVSRSKKERICVDFGDDTITSGQQFRIIYDDEGMEFVVGPGEGANPTRLNGKILASAMPLVTGDLIKAGQTTMRFVAFCGEDFNWN